MAPRFNTSVQGIAISTQPLSAPGIARTLYDAAVEAAAPEPAVRAALDGSTLELERRDSILVIAIGKAAGGMARAACEWLQAHALEPAAGVVVAPDSVPAPHPAVEVAIAEHPVPGEGSLRAAERIARVAAQARPGDLAIVLLSGGASSLMASPVAGVPAADLARMFETLLGSGLGIEQVNAIRRRFTRFGGGRLAATMPSVDILCLVLSDVPGDDPAVVGSGCCSPDRMTASDIRRILTEAELLEEMPGSLRSHLAAIQLGKFPETPKEGAPALAHVQTELVARNADAIVGSCARAADHGWEARIASAPLTGPADQAGERFARELLSLAEYAEEAPLVLLAGGETTVKLGRDSGRGGRCQQLALAAARVLHEAHPRFEVAVLAAGTDGRDGPTDAAGAIVDARSWGRIAATGRDPERALATHDSNPALAAIDALIRTGPTGTNVMDVAVGVLLPVR